MGMTALAVGMIVSAAASTYMAVDSHNAAKASEKASKNATLAQARLEGKAAAKEDAIRETAKANTAKEAQNLELGESLQKKKKKGVKSSYTASGALDGSTLSPIGGGDGSDAIASV